MSEFSLIKKYFSQVGSKNPLVKLGVGDDGAILHPCDQEQVIVMDTMVEDVHFIKGAHAHDVGHKILAVNLSDLAAMGATPAWATLAVSLPEDNEKWVAEFVKGFGNIATLYGVQLIGGDTTRGPLSVTVTAGGLVPPGKAVLRSGAKAGHALYVTGIIGEAGLALGFRQNRFQLSGQVLSRCIQRFDRPIPRVKEALAIRHLMHGAIDISDGLLADLVHMTEASQCAVRLYEDKLPITGAANAMSKAEDALDFILSCGDDYELLIAAEPESEAELKALLAPLQCNLQRVGEFVAGKDSVLVKRDQREVPLVARGYDHFGQ
ncbi:MAG: thiamine-phosphate kinase [Gammaproteobacteria bacterium]|nr:thiamine-phosphate kinase [Gammaproteobacteria bacterium]MDH5693611.1 thiamine-phosphate kinase [Gammaproteobacteria bacterium]